MSNKIYAVGLGPGAREQMTEEARRAMEKSDILCGYGVYVDLVRDLYPGKETFSTPMMKEIDRCCKAIELAQEGRTVAMVCSGDAGIYGMAGLLMELADKEAADVEIQVVAGVTAASSGAAVLGAPLSHDFCVISLSDLLTPWEKIETRLRCAAKGDFAICLYNPRSRRRPEHLRRAVEILLEEKSPETVCGWVRNIGRAGEEKKLLPLKDLACEQVDMFTTVYIGSETTRICGTRMVTPRGYENK